MVVSEARVGGDLWFKAHPKEELMNHSLVAVRHRARLRRAYLLRG